MPIQNTDSLRAELQAVRLASRQLSRAIGQAKQTGRSVESLVEEKKGLSARERELVTLLDSASETSQPAQQPATTPHPSGATQPWAVGSAAAVQLQGTEPVSTTLAAADDWAAWDAFVEQHPAASVYHLSGWRGVIQQAFQHDCPYLIAKRAGQVVGVMPLVRMQSRLFGHFMVSLPYFNYGGALSTDDAASAALVEKAIELAAAAGCRHIEMREAVPRQGFPARSEKVNMWLALPADTDALWLQLGSKLRAQIKKAQAFGLSYEVGGLDLLDDFYRVFSTNMRDLGTPVYGKDFFKAVLRHAPGQPELVVGRTTAGQAVSAALLVRHGNRMEVPWASTLRKANTLNANMGLYWHMLSLACQASCQVFDFGRSTKDAATYRFKKQWGAQPVESSWNYWLPDNGELPKLNPDNPKYRAAISVWKRMPITITQLLGPVIVKSIP